MAGQTTLIVFIGVFGMAASGQWKPMLVYPRFLEERSLDGRLALHIHDNLTLSLRKASVAARQFRVVELDDGREVTRFYNGKDIEKHLFEDENHWSTVHVTQKQSGLEVEGVVGPNLRIHPMPEMQRSGDVIVPHMIFEIEEDNVFDTVVLPNDRGHQQATERIYRSQPPVPSEVNIEVFIVSDGPHNGHFKNNSDLIVYFCITMNSVNMRYSETKDPKIKLLFTGVQRSPFDHYITASGNFMHDTSSLERFKHQAGLYKTIYGNPDVVYLATGRDLYSSDANGKANTNNIGIGYQAGLCTEYFVALGEDAAGYYTGIYTMAHEIAHVLGSAHDESPPLPSMPGHPGSQRCLWSSGFIMSYIDNGPNRHRFSECSLEQMRFVILLRGKLCWDVTGDEKREDGKYPGMQVSPDEYCRQVVKNQRNVTADMASATLLQCKLKCQYLVQQPYYYNGMLYHHNVYYYELHNTLDYMFCAAGKVCIRGVCQNRPVDVSNVPPPNTPTIHKPTTTTAVSTDECHCECPTTPASKTAARRRH
uniref:Peptidase M12B domain-containing protein n=1 Tax=Amblyomma maculatum TaxID=34609 RepID=G3MQF5_AMBMU